MTEREHTGKKIVDCQTIGPAAAGSAGYVASPMQYLERSFSLLVTSASDLSLRTIKCCSVVFGVTLRLLPRRHPRTTTSDGCHQLATVLSLSHIAVCITRGKARYWSRIAILPTHLHSTPLLVGPRRNIAMTFDMKQEVKVIRQKAPHGGLIPRLGVTPGGRNLYH